MRNNIEPEIDLVYLWVDGSDPAWQAKRNAFLGNTVESSELNCKGRFVDNDELKYSLRSVEKYAPWIRKIFIVTDHQTPSWLDTNNSKIQIVDHKEILPEESLPCFNSFAIESCLYKIRGLSEQFIYANDDMFINKPVSPSTFFAADGFPIIRFNRKLFRKIRWTLKEQILKKKLRNYSQTISNAANLIEKRYGIYYSGMPHHNIDAYLKTDCQRVTEQIFGNEFKTMQKNHTRSSNDIERIVYSYVALFEKRGHLCHPSKKDSLHIQIHTNCHYKIFRRCNPMLFCMNDSQYAQDRDRMRAKAFLENLFPQKSQFEK